MIFRFNLINKVIFLTLLLLLFLPVLVFADERQCCVCNTQDITDPNYKGAAQCFPDEDFSQCASRSTPLGAISNKRQSCRIIPCAQSNVCEAKPTYDLEPVKIKFNIPIPGLEQFSQGDGVVVTSETLPTYIGGLYKFLVGIAGILAVMVIAYGGIVWLFSGGSSEKISHAKELITGAIVGLLLALGSYLLLYTINPKLVNFTTFPVPEINVVEYVPEDAVCPSDKEVINIPAIPKMVIEGADDARLTPGTIGKLIIAARTINGTLVIKSAYRDDAAQARLYNCYKTKVDTGQCPAVCGSCNEAAEPKCTAPHQTGKAIDVCLRNGPNGFNTCSNNNKSLIDRACNKGACLSGTDQTKLNDAETYLQQVMIAAGFSHFCNEWWHFESTPMSTVCPAGQYR